MPRYICVKKTHQWGRLITEGEIVNIPDGVAVPHGTMKPDAEGNVQEVPYFERVDNPKRPLRTKAHLTARETKNLLNRMTSLTVRTNLTPEEEAEKERIKQRLNQLQGGTSLETRITREEVIKRKEKAVESAQGIQPMGMGETQKMRYDKAKAAKKKG